MGFSLDTGKKNTTKPKKTNGWTLTNLKMMELKWRDLSFNYGDCFRCSCWFFGKCKDAFGCYCINCNIPSQTNKKRSGESTENQVGHSLSKNPSRISGQGMVYNFLRAIFEGKSSILNHHWLVEVDTKNAQKQKLFLVAFLGG